LETANPPVIETLIDQEKTAKEELDNAFIVNTLFGKRRL